MSAAALGTWLLAAFLGMMMLGVVVIAVACYADSRRRRARLVVTDPSARQRVTRHAGDNEYGTRAPQRRRKPRFRGEPVVRPASNGRAGGRGTRTTVLPSREPLWASRGWRRQGSHLIGAYRTPLGSFSGMIEVDARDCARNYYILNPPRELLEGGHGACFRGRGKGRYWIHFNRPNADIDAGIVSVEKLLYQALAV